MDQQPSTTGQQLSFEAEAALARAMRDVLDGHITIWHGSDGADRPDRSVIGAPDRWWLVLRDRGLLHLPPHANRWMPTAEGFAFDWSSWRRQHGV